MKNMKYLTIFLLLTLLFCLLTAGSAFADFDETPVAAEMPVAETPKQVNTAVRQVPGETEQPVTEVPGDCIPDEEQKLPGMEVAADIEKTEGTADASEPGEDVPASGTEEAEDTPETAAGAQTGKPAAEESKPGEDVPASGTEEAEDTPETAAGAQTGKPAAEENKPVEGLPGPDAEETEDAPENTADAQTGKSAADENKPAGTPSDLEFPPEELNYSIKFSDGSGNTTYIKGAAQTVVSEILAGMGYELREDTVITYDPESVDTDVIIVSENEDGVLMLSNEKPFDRAARNLVLYVNGVAVELQITDDTEITANTGTITASGAYILNADIKLNKTIVISGQNVQVQIDLNGHVLDASAIADTLSQGAIRVMEEAILKIVDSHPGEKHSGDYDTLPDGGVIYGGKGFTVTDANKSYRMGGGILNEGSLEMGGYQAGVEISGGTVYKCSVTGDGGNTTCGGGIANYNGILTLRNTVIDSCTASGSNINEGGGIWDDGFAPTDNNPVNTVLTNVTIRNCSALDNTARGGGLFWSGQEDNEKAMLNNLTIEGCTSGNGGGLYLANSSNLDHLAIKNCSASENGGGIFVTSGRDGSEIVFTEDVTTTIENCSASEKGGGLYSNNGSIKVNGVLSLTGCSTTGTDSEGQYLFFVKSGPACQENKRGTITITTGTGIAPTTQKSLEIVSATEEYSLSILLSDKTNSPRLTSGDGYTLTWLYDSNNKINEMLLTVDTDDAVAWIGNVGYRTIQTAVTAAANGDVILVTADTSENIQIASGKEITINLNEKVLTGKDETKPVISNSGKLTVTGGRINGTTTGIANSSDGTVTVSGNNTAITGIATAIDNSGILNVSGGSVGSAGGNIGIKNQGNGRTYITGGQISAGSNAIYNAQNATVSVASTGGNNTTVHAADGAAIDNEGTLSVFGGDVSSSTGTGVLNKGSATLSGGSVTGNTGIMNSGTGTVTVNGTCVVNGNTAIINSSFLGEEYGLTIGGSAKVTGQDIGIKNTGDGNIHINGGTVSGNGDGAVGILNESVHDVKIDDGKIQGTTGVKNTGTGNIQFTNGTVEGETAVENKGTGAVAIAGGYFDGVRTSLRNSGTGSFQISGGSFDRKSPASPIELTDGDILIINVTEDYLAAFKNILSDDYVVTDTKYPGTSCINVVRTLAVVDGVKAGTVTDIKSLISTDGEHDIVLKDDVNATAAIAITGSKTVNVDLNGHVINGNNTDSVLSVGEDATLNVSNGDPMVFGGVYGGDAAAVEVSGGSVNINAGTFRSSNSAVIVNDGDLTVNGGTFFGALERNAGTLTVHAGNFDADPGIFVPDGYHMEYDGTSHMYRVTKNAPASDPVTVPKQGITVVVEPVGESALNEAQRSSVDAIVSGNENLVAVLDVYLSGGEEAAHVNPDAAFDFKIDKAHFEGHEPSALRIYLIKEDGTFVEVEFETDEDGNLIINGGKLGKYIIVYI